MRYSDRHHAEVSLPGRAVAVGVAALLLVSSVVSCVSTQLPPASRAGAAFEPLPDEEELWSQARLEESRLRGAVYLYDDPDLEAYLGEVVDRLTAPGMAANRHLRYRVSVIDAPELNAFAYPHGSIYVHTGLLARLENEAQLATLLGHEMGHVDGRHMLRHRRALHNRELGFSMASLALSIALDEAEADLWWDGNYEEAVLVGVLGELLLGLGMQLAFTASVNGYGRELEWEADHGGIDRLAAAGYPLAEAPRLYETLRDSARATPGGAVNFFFGSHPRLTRRVEVARQLVAARSTGASLAAQPRDGSGEGAASVPDRAFRTEDDESAGMRTDRDDERLSPEDARFRRALAPVVRDQGFWHLSEGRLGEAEDHLRRARDWAPRDPLVHLLRGQLRLTQAEEAESPEERDWMRADAGRAFLEAIRLDPDLPEAHRDLGFLLYEDGDPAGACRELGFYLELAPDAENADVVGDYVDELEPLGYCAP